ncbi:succinate dehydrogenase iron-sulfur subunit [Rhabdochlamydiaceae symbiont of Dictyostelium giganteum]|uniref:succinate dehydrogenase iron-sulfur subunit n=1 Tax=Rhabdochlamydiaceae symbiont of Dictyostelium giganteum TaxID=3342349 RepID=UPI00384C6E90
MTQFILKVYRGVPHHQYWEEFLLTLKPFYNVISALMDIQKDPINRQGKRVNPIAWEQGCLEEVCGSCSMLVNGFPRQACTALIEPLLAKTQNNTVTLAPFTKFPLIRDLVVDRSVMFEHLKRIQGWVEVDSSFAQGTPPTQDPQVAEARYVLSTCMTCGCCLEGCPQVNPRSKFIGPAAISQVRLFNAHPVGKLKGGERLRVLMEEGGVSDCGNAQNCAKVCPKKIPLTESIAKMGRDTTRQALRDLTSLPDEG